MIGQIGMKEFGLVPAGDARLVPLAARGLMIRPISMRQRPGVCNARVSLVSLPGSSFQISRFCIRMECPGEQHAGNKTTPAALEYGIIRTMIKPCVLGIGVGSSSAKVGLFDLAG